MWVYDFVDLENLTVGKEMWRWKLGPACPVCPWDGCQLPSICFYVPIAPLPQIPGLEHGTAQEETRHVWKTETAKIVLANADASVIEVLERQG
jgi:hypothetical protein